MICLDLFDIVATKEDIEGLITVILKIGLKLFQIYVKDLSNRLYEVN